MLKAIIFDFGNTLIFKRPDHSSDKLIDEIDYQLGQVTDDVRFKEETLFKYDLSEIEFNEILRKIVDKYEKCGKVWAILPKLREKYKLAIINNGSYLTFPAFNKKFKISKNFDLFISSAIEGVKKPDRKIYLKTLEKLGLEPRECLFFDDLKENVESANKIGIKSYLWKNCDQGFDLLRSKINFS